MRVCMYVCVCVFIFSCSSMIKMTLPLYINYFIKIYISYCIYSIVFVLSVGFIQYVFTQLTKFKV